MLRYPVAFLLTLGFAATASAGNLHVPPVKNLIVIIDAGGEAHIGNDTLMISELSAELQRRLWKSYMGTGKMYDSIKLEFEGEVLMGTRGAAMDAIQLAQKNALKEICLEKHKKLFENLNENQRIKLKKQFPVLFQTTYQ